MRPHANLALLIAAIVGILLSILSYVPNLAGSQDIQVYERIGSDVFRVTHAPDDTLKSEYPPLASAVFSVVETTPFLEFPTAWAGFLALAIAVTLFGITLIGGVNAGLTSALGLLLSVFLLGPEVIVARFDILLALLLLLTWQSHARGWYQLSGCVLILAAFLKLVPLLLLPVLLLSTPRGKRMDVIVGGMIGVLLGVAVPLLLLSPAGVIENLSHMQSYHSGRGVQLESTLSGLHLLSMQMMGSKAPMEFVALSAQNMAFGGTTAVLLLLILLGGLGALSYFLWKRKPAGTELAPVMCASLLWTLLLSPVLSPQYFVWLLPLGFAWLLSRLFDHRRFDKETAKMFLVLSSIALCTQWVYPVNYGAFLSQSSFMLIVVHTARTVLMASLLWMILRPLVLRTKKLPAAPPLSREQRRGIVAVSSVLLGCSLLALAWTQRSMRPIPSPVVFAFEGRESESGPLPLFVPTQGPSLRVSFTLDLARLHPVILRIKPDDCLTELQVNGQTLTGEQYLFCDFGTGKPVQLRGILQPGLNTFSATISDQGGLGGINVSVDPTDPLQSLLHLWLTGSLVLFAAVIVWMQRRSGKSIALPLIFAGGVLLRLLYFLATPYSVRGHDTDAHIDYIRFVADHLTIPPAQDGWEFHQPPLYYFFTGLLMRAERFFGRDANATLFDIQCTSLLLSVATLIVGFFILRRIFPRKEQESQLLLSAGLLATFPSLIFLASGITNDTLAQLLGFCVVFFLLCFWQKGKLSDWYLTCIMISLSLITKVSAALFLPAAFLPFLLHRSLTWKQKSFHAASSFLLIVLLAGWLPFVRVAIEGETSRTLSLGNEGMHSGLLLTNDWSNFLTFNPIEILRHPYNNPWDEATRRRFFFEYLYRSAFFGEYSFDGNLKLLTLAILFTGFFVLLLSLYGLATELRRHFRRSLPLTLLLCLLFAASLAYRLRFTYSANQDFRFIVLSILPLIVFAVRGIPTLPSFLRTSALAFCLAFLACSALFIAGVSLLPT